MTVKSTVSPTLRCRAGPGRVPFIRKAFLENALLESVGPQVTSMVKGIWPEVERQAELVESLVAAVS